MSQSNSLGYGVPTVGHLVIGGENSKDFPLIAVNYGESYTQDFVTAIFRVIARGATSDARSADMQTKLAALDDLSQHSGNLCWGGDEESNGSITVSISVSGKDITVTRTAGTRDFSVSDVGRIIDIVGVGSFMISGFTSTTIVTCKANSQLAAPSNDTGLTASIPVPLRRVRESNKLGGMQIRTTTRPIQDPRDHKFRRTFGLEMTIEKPADAAVDSGRRRASISVSTNSATDLRTVVFRGLYTALSTGADSANSAIANYEANAPTWVSGFLTLISGSYEKRQDVYEVHDEYNLLSFTQVYVEKNFNDSIAALDDSRITNAQVKMVRRSRNLIGNPLYEAPTFVQIAYSAEIKKAQGHDTIVSIYANTIKPHLMAEIQSKFSGSNPVIIDEYVTVDPENMGVSAFLDVFLRRGNSPNVLAFAKTVSWNLSTRNDVRQRWDGIPHRYVIFTPGPQITAVTRVSTRVIGGAGYLGSSNFRIGSDGLIFVGRQGGDENAQDTNEFQVPGDPPYNRVSTGGEGWLLLEAQADVSPFARGLDVERIGSTDVTTDAVYTAVWLWCSVEADAPLRDDLTDPIPGEIDDPSARQPTDNPSVGDPFSGVADTIGDAVAGVAQGIFSSVAPSAPSVGDAAQPKLF